MSCFYLPAKLTSTATAIPWSFSLKADGGFLLVFFFFPFKWDSHLFQGFWGRWTEKNVSFSLPTQIYSKTSSPLQHALNLESAGAIKRKPLIIHPWFIILKYKKAASYKREAGAFKSVEFRTSLQNPYTYKRLYNGNIKTNWECFLFQLCVSSRVWIRSTWATQFVSQGQRLAVFTSPAEAAGPALSRSVLPQHCTDDGESDCFIERKFGVGLGLFRAAFPEIFSTHSNVVYQITA